jgi:glutathione synthase/RimK-type ligase-like ATP-grasp enzyme
LPIIDGEPVPILSAAQWTRIPDEWVQNLHRGEAPRPVT